MDLLLGALMDKPSITGPICPFCGRKATQAHHIVPRSLGGTNGPTIKVCGFGNAAGCHGLLEQHKLHLRWNDEIQWWEYLRTPESTKYQKALEMEGWVELNAF